MTLLKIVAALVLAVLVLAVAAGGVGSMLWSRATRQAVDRVVARAGPPPAAPTLELPPPVGRYLDRAIPGGAPIRVARIRQEGEFLLSPPDGWAPFSATQLFTVSPPAMVWDATIRMAPLVSVRVRDSYIDGVGSMNAAVLGVFTVLEDSGPDAMAEASLARYLAEGAWFPSRLRPSAALRWTAVDDSTALATLADGDLAVTLEFRFEGTEIRAVYAERRFRGQAEDPTWAPWIGRFRSYQAMDGFVIPTEAEVAWIIDGEERPYWRGEITDAYYEP